MKIESLLGGEGRCSSERIRWDKIVKILLTLKAEKLVRIIKIEVARKEMRVY